MFLLSDGSASLNSSRSMMDESSLFHYASDSPLGPNGDGGRGSIGGLGQQCGEKDFTWAVKATELVENSSSAKCEINKNYPVLSACFFCWSPLLNIFDVHSLCFPCTANRNTGTWLGQEEESTLQEGLWGRTLWFISGLFKDSIC